LRFGSGSRQTDKREYHEKKSNRYFHVAKCRKSRPSVEVNPDQHHSRPPSVAIRSAELSAGRINVTDTLSMNLGAFLA